MRHRDKILYVVLLTVALFMLLHLRILQRDTVELSAQMGTMRDILNSVFDRTNTRLRMSSAIAPATLLSYGFSSPFTAWIASNAVRMETSPFQGVTVASMLIPVGDFDYFSRQVLRNVAFTQSQVQPDINNLQVLKASRVLTNNLYPLYTSNFDPPDVFDSWTTPLANTLILAQIVKDGGLRGVFIDPEHYGPTTWNYETRLYVGTKTLVEYRTQARLRGTQFIQALNSLAPNIDIVMPYCFQLGMAGDPSFGSYELLEAFCDGMIQGADAGTVVHEVMARSYGDKTASAMQTRQKNLRAFAQSVTASTALLAAHYKIGVGLWVDYFSSSVDCGNRWDWNVTNFSCNWFTPAELETTVTIALRAADTGSYVWIYDEKPNWWTGVLVPPEYVTALRNARLAAAAPVMLGTSP